MGIASPGSAREKLGVVPMMLALAAAAAIGAALGFVVQNTSLGKGGDKPAASASPSSLPSASPGQG